MIGSRNPPRKRGEVAAQRADFAAGRDNAPALSLSGVGAKFLHSLFQPIGSATNGGVFVACLLATTLLHYPGHVPNDGVTIWFEARQATLISQHPPMMALIWHFLEQVLPGPGGMLLLQLVMLWLCPLLIVGRLRPSFALGLAAYLLLLIWPPIFALSGQLQKDMLGAHFAVVALLAVLLPPRRTGPFQTMVAASILMTVAALLRYQYAIVFLGLVVALWWRRSDADGKTRLRTAGTFLGATLVTAILAGLAVSFTFVRAGNGDVAQSVRKILVFDIAGVIANDPAVSVSTLVSAGVEEAELKRRILELYSPDRVDTLWEPDKMPPSSNEPLGVFAMLAAVPDHVIRTQWEALAMAAPGTLMAHRMAAFLRVVGVGDVYACWPVYTGMYQANENTARYLDMASYTPAASSVLLKHRYFPAGSFLFRPGLYGLVGLVIVISFLLHCPVPFAAFVLAASGIAYELTFFVLPQACDVRYSYFLMLTVLGAALLVALSVAEKVTLRSYRAGG